MTAHRLSVRYIHTYSRPSRRAQHDSAARALLHSLELYADDDAKLFAVAVSVEEEHVVAALFLQCAGYGREAVVAVDTDYQRRGIGFELTYGAGLWLASRNSAIWMEAVTDAGNCLARALGATDCGAGVFELDLFEGYK